MESNILEMLRQLKKEGFTDNQAEVIVKQIMAALQDSDLVTKDFLENRLAVLKSELIADGTCRFAQLEVKMAESEAKMAIHLAESEKKMATQLSESEKRLDGKINKLEIFISNLESRLIIWMVGAQMATILLILGIFYFFASEFVARCLPLPNIGRIHESDCMKFPGVFGAAQGAKTTSYLRLDLQQLL